MEDQKSTEQVVTPWDVSGGADGKIDYNKLVEQFGCQTIHQELIERIEKVTGVPSHPFLKRRVFFAHCAKVQCQVLCHGICVCPRRALKSKKERCFGYTCGLCVY